MKVRFDYNEKSGGAQLKEKDFGKRGQKRTPRGQGEDTLWTGGGQGGRDGLSVFSSFFIMEKEKNMKKGKIWKKKKGSSIPIGTIGAERQKKLSV